MRAKIGRAAGLVGAIALAQVVAACAIIDSYSGRAVDFNREAELAQEQVLLLNIVRASLRRPMQFTSLQSVTGSGSASGSLQGGAISTRQTPLISLFGLTPPAASTVISRIASANVSGNAQLSGSATFTVPVLDTQEFYQGILNPIPLQAFDYYLQQGFPPQLLFDLFVQKIEITRLDDGACRKFTFTNSVRNDLEFAQFQTFVDYLIGSGLSAERVTLTTAYGPPIRPPSGETASAADTARVVEAFSKASAAGLHIRQETKGEKSSYRLQKRNSQFRFCFSYPGGPPSDWVGQPNSAMFCGHFNRARASVARSVEDGGDGRAECTPRLRATRSTAADDRDVDYDSRSQGLHEGGVSEFRGIRLAAPFLERMNNLQQAAQAARPGIAREQLFPVNGFAGGVVSFRVYTRSTQGILYYLGEVTRRRLFTEFGDQPRTIQVKTALRYGTFPLSECHDAENNASWQQKDDLVYLGRRRDAGEAPGSYYCENLFVLDNPDRALGDHVIGVTYDRMVFGIPRDPNRHGRTLQVLELVKQLLALNTSAKQLPSTSVLSVISP
jgi:hypothetical protein